MVYYIRFLKTPRIQKLKAGSCSISALVCITTDLGDSFLSDNVDLLATIALEHTSSVLYQKAIVWQAGKRELPISLGPFPPQFSKQNIVLGISSTTDPRRPHPPSADNILDRSSVPLVISGWSAPFGGSRSLVADKLIERRFGPKDKLDLRIWEETGNSIARHIWDAALASVSYLQEAINGRAEAMPLLQEILQGRRSTPLRILELGTGCGIVGIALSQLLSQCSVVLTDLAEVEDIVTHNMAGSKPAASSSTIEFQVLDWDEELPGGACSDRIDLILVSDCTYNADSLPALVSVMDKLVQLSPEALILVAVKRRHDSESIFFELMQSAALCTLDQDCIKLPSQHDEEDQIELYAYGRKERRSST